MGYSKQTWKESHIPHGVFGLCTQHLQQVSREHYMHHASLCIALEVQ